MRYLLFIALFAPTTAFSGQPQHVSMAQCGGITQAMASRVQTPWRQEKLRKYVDLWRSTANAEAGEDMEPVLQETARIWMADGSGLMESDNFETWIKYCGRLARRTGLSEKAEQIKRGG